MTDLASKVISAYAGKTLATAESCTGGGIGQALTAVAGSSAVYKGGIVSYCDEIKRSLLGVAEDTLKTYSAVSAAVAEEMAFGARRALKADVSVSVTGLAGPGGDVYGNPVGTVFIGYASAKQTFSREYHFPGDRDAVRSQAITEALSLLLEMAKE